MSRYDLTEFERRLIQPRLPIKPRGIPRVDDRRVLNGKFWVLRSGLLWCDLPGRYGPHTICYNRFRRWITAGIWDRIIDTITDAYGSNVRKIDGTSVRVHHSAVNLKKPPGSSYWTKPGRSYYKNPSFDRRRRPAGTVRHHPTQHP